MDSSNTTFPVSLEHAVDMLSRMPSPDDVRRLEDEVRAQGDIVDVPTHMMVHGEIAVRTVFIRAGTLVTGALTNHDNVCFVSGDIVATTDEGVVRLTGYSVFPAARGFKRAVVALSDTYWSTAWHTKCADARSAEDDMTDEHDRLLTRRGELEAQECQHLTTKEN